MFNNKIFPLPGNFILVIGGIDIEINAEITSGFSVIDYVELYIDDELVQNFTSEPYVWTWDETGFGKHTLMAIAFDTMDNQESIEITTWKIL